MSDYAISIPERLYEKAEYMAQRTSKQVEDVIRTYLERALYDPFFGWLLDERGALKILTLLSDEDLFALIHLPMPRAKRDRLLILTDKNADKTITKEEYREFAALVEDDLRLTLRKTAAVNLLMDRGFWVELDIIKAFEEQP